LRRPVIRYFILTGLVTVLLLAGCQPGAMPTISMPRTATTPTTTPRVNAVLAPPTGTAGIMIDAPQVPTAAASASDTPTISGLMPLPTSPTPSNIPLTDTGVPAPALPTSPIPVSDPPADIVPTEDPVAPGPVTGLSAQVVGLSEISLAWNPSETEILKCYSVYRSTQANGSYAWLASPDVTYYRDTGLDQSVTYYYYVEAIDYADNKGEKSAVVSATIAAPVVLELFGKDG